MFIFIKIILKILKYDLLKNDIWDLILKKYHKQTKNKIKECCQSCLYCSLNSHQCACPPLFTNGETLTCIGGLNRIARSGFFISTPHIAQVSTTGTFSSLTCQSTAHSYTSPSLLSSDQILSVELGMECDWTSTQCFADLKQNS